MTGHEEAVHDGGTDRGAGPLPFDTSVAHQARMYDYMLGGKDNYAADRAAVEATLKVYPDAAFTTRANRAFLGRVIRYLAADAGIRQFLDIGTGIPTCLRAVTSSCRTGGRTCSAGKPGTACTTSGAGWSSSHLRSAAASRWRSSSRARTW